MTGATLVLDENSGHVVRIGNNNHLIFENITIKGGYAYDVQMPGVPEDNFRGGGLYIDGNSKITLLNGTRITGNYAIRRGGGIWIGNGELTINGAEISKNNADSFGGGGLYAEGSAVVTFESGLFTANTVNTLTEVSAYGGGIYIEGGNANFVMNGGAISANTGAVKGGGIYVGSGTVAINGGTIHSNAADHKSPSTSFPAGMNTGGGGIYVGGGTVQIRGATIYRNNANVYYMSGGVPIYNSTNGGGIHVNNGTLTYDDSVTISGNTAPNAVVASKSIYAASAATVIGGAWSHTGSGPAAGYDSDITPP